MKSAAADIDTELVRWSLSWKPDGCSDSFTKMAILACAPQTSGVYGLFNFDCQIFIGEADSIQDALLRHESETDFQSGHLRPTGFTFEPCVPELRAAKAAELIARFRPVLQTQAALNEAPPKSNDSIASEPIIVDLVMEAAVEHQEFPAHQDEERPRVDRRANFNRRRVVSLALFAANAVVIVYLALFTNNNIQEHASGASEKSPPRIPAAPPIASDQARMDSGVKKVALTDTAYSAAHQSAALKPAKPETSAANSDGTKKWSVQIAAVPTKADADGMAQQLKAAGYDSRVVKAEVKGQTYYRVRVGHFDLREEAESARQSLARQDAYRDAYIAND